MKNIVLGVSYRYDSGAALLVDGEIVAAINEERLNRIKMYSGFPEQSIVECLRIAGVAPEAVGRVAVGGRMNFLYESGVESATPTYRLSDALSRTGVLRLLIGNRPSAYLLRAFFGNRWNPVFNRHKELATRLQQLGITTSIEYFDHHHCHNAAAFFASGFDVAHAVSIDAFGDCFSSRVYACRGGEMELVRSVPAYHSPAHHYAYVTALLGFMPTRHEGKVTGLAAFGNPNGTAKIIGERVSYSPVSRSPIVHGLYQKAELEYLRTALAGFTKEDIAAGVQQVLEQIVTSYLADNAPPSASPRLVLGGGVPANVRLNQVIREMGYDDVYIFPHMGDGGLAVGACFAANATETGSARNRPMSHAYLGTGYSSGEIEQSLQGSGFTWQKAADVDEQVASHVAAGNIVARFTGRMEYGPRALCHRSIFYKADDPHVNSWLNTRLKRTEFMPFAPVMLREDAPRFLRDYEDDHSLAARYMTMTYDVTDLCRECAPAVVHVDGTARPQIVDADADAPAYRMLSAYKKLRGFSVMVNTSFNMHEEPIVRTPSEAIESVRQAGLDVLAIGDYIALNCDAGVRGA